MYHRRVRCRAPARLPERTAARREQSKGSLRQSQRGSQRRRRHHHRRVQGVGCDVATSRTSDDPWGVGGDACARRGRTDVRRRSRKACRTHKKVGILVRVASTLRHWALPRNVRLRDGAKKCRWTPKYGTDLPVTPMHCYSCGPGPVHSPCIPLLSWMPEPRPPVFDR